MSREIKMTSCKACGQEIAASAKVCPHCGAKHKTGHPVLIGIIAVVLLAAIIGAAGGEEAPQKVDPSPNSSTGDQTGTSTSGSVQDDKTVFYVGETAALSGIQVTFVNITENEGSTFNTPTEGNVFVLCEFEIANNSDAELAVSSMLSFEAYCDDYACNYSLSALLEAGNKNQLDGTVAPGKKLNGVIGYEVPADWSTLEVIFTPDYWTGKDITFLATHE